MFWQGTGVLADNAGGMHTSETVFYDDKPDEIERLLNDGAIHRQVDINILNHAKKWAEKGDLAKIRLMVPPFMFGKGAGPFKDISVQVPSVVRAAKDVKYAPVHGEVSLAMKALHAHSSNAGHLRGKQSPLTSKSTTWRRDMPSSW